MKSAMPRRWHVVASQSQVALKVNGNGMLQAHPFTSLINTKQLNNALWGIVNKRPKADYLRGKRASGDHLHP